MSLSDGPGEASEHAEQSEQTTGAIERTYHAMNRREPGSMRRRGSLQQKHTDTLPVVNGDTPGGKVAWRQVIQLREENRRLRWEYNALQAQFDAEIAAIHSGHQQEIEQYQSHLRDLLEERNHMQEAHLELEQRYQDLYHSFQDAVEEEAQKMVTEAAQTVEESPGHTPDLLQRVRKTIELQAKQEEDQHVVQALYLMREAQNKAQQLEQELDQERKQIAAERQNLLTLQESIRSQAQLRYDAQKKHLQAQWMGSVILAVMIALVSMLVIQGIIFAFWASFYGSSIVAFLMCMAVAGVLARSWSQRTPVRKRTTAKQDNPAKQSKPSA